jgi:hypothetical protein
MKKAFDSNVAKFKPRLRARVEEATTLEGEGGAAADAAMGAADPASDLTPNIAVTAGHAEVVAAAERPSDPVVAGAPAKVESTVARASGAVVSAATPSDKAPRTTAEASAARTVEAPLRGFVAAATEPTQEAASNMAERRERLERVKRRVREAAAPVPVVPPMTTPGAAGESALALLRDVEGRLAKAKETEEALRADLADARGEQARSAADLKRTNERVAALDRALDEKRSVLADMLAEMGALEEERDEAVRRAQALSVLDEERAQVLVDVTGELERTRAELSAARGEMERLSDDLDNRAGEAARLRAALAEVTRERDGLSREAASLRRERDELVEARRALEQVHEALAQVRSRIA